MDSYYALLGSGKLKLEHKEPSVYAFSFYIDAFFELSTCRNGLSASPIPFTAIVEYAKIYKVDNFDEFIYYMRRLDSVFLDWVEKNEQASKKN